MKCKRNSQHVYDDGLKSCPWCERMTQLNGNDPFPSEQAVRKGEHLKTAPNATKMPPSAANIASPVTTTNPTRNSPPPPPRPVPSFTYSPKPVSRKTKSSSASKKQADGNYFWLVGLGILSIIYLFNQANRSATSSSSYSRRSASTPTLRMLPPAREWVKTPIMGMWRGRFSNHNAALKIQRRRSNEFWGRLTIFRDSKVTHHIAIHGTLPGNGGVTMRETSVLFPQGGANWTLGTDVGTFSGNARAMFGIGTDSGKTTYQWSFTQQSPLRPKGIRSSKSHVSSHTSPTTRKKRLVAKPRYVTHPTPASISVSTPHLGSAPARDRVSRSSQLVVPERSVVTGRTRKRQRNPLPTSATNFNDSMKAQPPLAKDQATIRPARSTSIVRPQRNNFERRERRSERPEVRAEAGPPPEINSAGAEAGLPPS